jgi:hypothetical protein
MVSLLAEIVDLPPHKVAVTHRKRFASYRKPHWMQGLLLPHITNFEYNIKFLDLWMRRIGL